jgi:fructose-1,6-bisphosphatase/inositol monophosphatase family enzyme
VSEFNSKKYPIYAGFLNQLAKDLTTFYYSKLNKTFKVSNKLKGKGYDPVTTSDRAFEKFIRSKINKKFPDHQIIGEEYGHQSSKSDFTWVIDPIDGTRSFVIGNPTWSNLISVNKKAKFNNVKVSAAFHGWLSLDKQKKIPQILKLMQFPCSDALSYSHLADGRVDIVIQCSNKIWDIHPVIPIIKAAGGIISTWDNQDAVKAGNILVSANLDIHKKFLKLLKPVSK